METTLKTSGSLFTSCSRSQRLSQSWLSGEQHIFGVMFPSFKLILAYITCVFFYFSSKHHYFSLMCEQSGRQRRRIYSHRSCRLSSQMVEPRYKRKQGESGTQNGNYCVLNHIPILLKFLLMSFER